MLRSYQAPEVVELGESIGVETRLYPEQAQQARIRALALVRRSQAMASAREGMAANDLLAAGSATALACPRGLEGFWQAAEP